MGSQNFGVQEKPARLASLLADIERGVNLCAQRVVVGVPALQRLVGVAERDTGQARSVRRLLLALYNPFEWPLDMRTLRALDHELQMDALDAIQLDWCGAEIHTYLAEGDEIFKRLWEAEAPSQR